MWVLKGIESEKIYTMLKNYNCDIGQGFFMSKPVPGIEINEWLSNVKWKIATH